MKMTEATNESAYGALLGYAMRLADIFGKHAVGTSPSIEDQANGRDFASIISTIFRLFIFRYPEEKRVDLATIFLYVRDIVLPRTRMEGIFRDEFSAYIAKIRKIYRISNETPESVLTELIRIADEISRAYDNDNDKFI